MEAKRQTTGVTYLNETFNSLGHTRVVVVEETDGRDNWDHKNKSQNFSSCIPSYSVGPLPSQLLTIACRVS